MFLTMRVLMCMWKWMSGSTWVYVFMNLCDWTCRNIHVIEWILVQVCTEWIYYSVTSYVYLFEYIYEHVSEKAMASHSSTLAWKIPWMEKSGGLQSMGSLRVRHDWATSLSLFTFMHWRRKWQPTRVLAWRIPGTGEPGGLQSMGSHRVGHDWSELAAAAAAAWACSREAMMVWAHLY